MYSKIELPIAIFFYIALLVLITPLFVPLAPKMPAPGIDASWALALNQAVAQGLSFGQQIIFTLGPYAAIYTKVYHPGTDLMMMGGSFFIAIAYTLVLALLMKKNKVYWNVLFIVCLLTMSYAKDALFFSYALLVGIFIGNQFETNARISLYHRFVLSVLLSPLGLFTLIKGSLLLLSLSVCFLFFLFFLCNKQRWNAVLCIVVPLVSLTLFWIGAGQWVKDIPVFLKNSLYIAAEFSEAMGNQGSPLEVLVYVLASSMVLLFLCVQKQRNHLLKLFLLTLFFIYLFLSFKAGFTRHFGHAYVAGTALLIAGIAILYCTKSLWNVLVMLCCLVASLYINTQYTEISVMNNLKSLYYSAWHGAKSRINDPEWAKQNYIYAKYFLRNQHDFTYLSGTTDIYSYDQSYLIGSDVSWSPRPIFQSYSVFNSFLAEQNRRHLLTDSAPTNIIFKIQPIDQRFPSLEDGLSWPILLQKYHPVGWENEFLILKKNAFADPRKRHLLYSANYRINELVHLPQSKQFILATFEFTPTWLGRLARIFYHMSPLYLDITFEDGTERHYRIIANMARSPFLLSPLVENTHDFSVLYQPNIEDKAKFISTFKIRKKSDSKQWDKLYHCSFFIF